MEEKKGATMTEPQPSPSDRVQQIQMQWRNGTMPRDIERRERQERERNGT